MGSVPRSRARSLAALLLLLVLLLVLLPPGLSRADPLPRAQELVELDESLVVEVETLSPRAPAPGGVLEVTGLLRNRGSAQVSSPRVSLRVGERLDSRSAIARAELVPGGTRRVVTTELDPTPILPGATRAFRVRVLVDSLGLERSGAYPLQVEARGRLAPGARLRGLGRARTFLPWFETAPTGATRLAFVWPLLADPVRASRTTPQGAVLLDDSLATSLAGEGRLASALRTVQMVRDSQRCDRVPEPARTSAPAPRTPQSSAPCRREPVPLTLALDGDLLETVDAMRVPYRVRAPESPTSPPRAPVETTPGRAQATASIWLETLRRLSETADVITLPFADADLDVLATTPSEPAGELPAAVRLGVSSVGELVSAEVLEGVTLAPPGPLSPAAARAHLALQTRALVLSEDALPLRPATQTATSPTRRLVTLPGAPPLPVLVADLGLSRLLAPDPTAASWQGVRLAEQRWLVEAAMVSAEAPGLTRTLLVAPPRDALLLPAVAGNAVLDAGRLPGLCPVPLRDVLAGSERCPAGGLVGPTTPPLLTPLLAAPAPRLSTAQREALADARGRLDQLTRRVLAPTPAAEATRARLLRGLLRASSTSWRDPARAPRGRVLAGLVREDVDDLLGRVSILTGPVTLTSTRGSVVVDIQNQLDQAVLIRVSVTSDTAGRLAVDDRALLQVAPRTNLQVRLPARPRTSGSFPVRARLLDRDGGELGEPSTFVLRSTRYGALAPGLTLVAAVVFLLSSARHFSRASRASRAARAGDAPGAVSGAVVSDAVVPGGVGGAHEHSPPPAREP